MLEIVRNDSKVYVYGKIFFRNELQLPAGEFLPELLPKFGDSFQYGVGFFSLTMKFGANLSPNLL